MNKERKTKQAFKAQPQWIRRGRPRKECEQCTGKIASDRGVELNIFNLLSGWMDGWMDGWMNE